MSDTVLEETPGGGSGVTTVEMLRKGVGNAVAGLSQMLGQEIKIASINLTKVLVKDIPELFGGAQAMKVGVYLAICGHSNGHMVAIYEPQNAFDLIDLLLGQPAGTTKELHDMEQSVLGEVGNIMGSFFLNHLANSTGMDLQPSPPAVLMDMTGAILEVATVSALECSDYTYVIDTVFESPDRQVTGTFLVMPVPGMETI
jgi:chemotaxis protein CheC